MTAGQLQAEIYNGTKIEWEPPERSRPMEPKTGELWLAAFEVISHHRIPDDDRYYRLEKALAAFL